MSGFDEGDGVFRAVRDCKACFGVQVCTNVTGHGNGAAVVLVEIEDLRCPQGTVPVPLAPTLIDHNAHVRVLLVT
jgi:hypothetical protein